MFYNGRLMSLNRLIDAALNRGGEGLRTLEDIARFILDDIELSGSLKGLRHDLRVVAAALWPAGNVVWSRNTEGDVGTQIDTPTEHLRSSLASVAAAATRRAAEAIRSLEEVAKLNNFAAASDLERLRYRLYDLGASVERRLGTGSSQWRLCLLLTEAACQLPWRQVLEAGLAGGVDCVQVREKHMDARSMLDRVGEVMDICRATGVPVIVNDRLDVALAAGAAGVHLGQTDLPIGEARKQCGRRLIVGLSTHGPAEAVAAAKAGADYIGIGPIYSTSTKPNLTAAGIGRVAETLPVIGGLPHLAIGGITPELVGDLRAAGAQGIAVGSAICGSPDPEGVATACLRSQSAVHP